MKNLLFVLFVLVSFGNANSQHAEMLVQIELSIEYTYYAVGESDYMSTYSDPPINEDALLVNTEGILDYEPASLGRLTLVEGDAPNYDASILSEEKSVMFENKLAPQMIPDLDELKFIQLGTMPTWVLPTNPVWNGTVGHEFLLPTVVGLKLNL